MEIGTYHFTHGTKPQIPGHKYVMDTYMTTILKVRLGTCVESWVEPKARPNSQHTNPVNGFAQINQDLTLMRTNYILMVS